MKKHLFSAVFIFLVCLILLTLSVSAESGQTGSCTWTLDGTVLTISGSGATENYTSGKQPWGLNVTEVIIEEGVTSLGDFIFSMEESMVSVHLPSTLNSIGQGAFYNCISLVEIALPEHLKIIKDTAFADCKKLTSLHIPASVTTILDTPFPNCDSLVAFSVDPDNPNYVSVDGVLFTKDMTELLRYPAAKEGTSYVIPDTVISLWNFAFHHTPSLTKVDLPDSIRRIASTTFSQCGAAILAQNAAYDGGIYIGKYLIGMKDNKMASYTVRPETIAIAENALTNCPNLREIILPEGLISIGNYAFIFNSKLVSITLPKSLEQIGKGACIQCPSLKNIYYRGTKADHSNLRIDTLNNEISSQSTWHFDSCNNQAEHDWNEPTLVRKETCTESGELLHYCPTCDLSRTEIIPAAAHAFGTWVIVSEPTCTTSGEKYHVCKNCDYVETDLPKELGHAFLEWVTDTPADCTTPGEQSRRCSVCDHTEKKGIPAPGHKPGDWVLTAPAKCDATGEEKKLCTVCKKELESRVLPLIDHTLGDWTLTQEPLCSRIGIETKSCQFCDYKEQRQLPMTEHTYGDWKITTPPTCLESGIQEKKCIQCDHTVADTVEAAGHNFGDYTVAIEPTLRAEGREDSFCEHCDEVISRPLPKKEFDFTIIIILVVILGVAGTVVLNITVTRKKRK